MKCFFRDCDQEGRGYPFEHKWLITPYLLDLCNSHAAELFGFLESRDALALERFAKMGNFTIVLRDNLVTIAARLVYKERHDSLR